MDKKKIFQSIKSLEAKDKQYEEVKSGPKKTEEQVQREIDEEVQRRVELELKKKKPISKLISLPYDYDRKLKDICDTLYDYKYHKNTSALLLEYVKSGIDKDYKKIKN